MSRPADNSFTPLLDVKNLDVHLVTSRGLVRAVDGVSFSLAKGKTLAIVGESGCGKSMLCRSIMGLAPASALTPDRSKVIFKNKNLLEFKENQFNQIRGRQLAMILQNPLSTLNPVLTIGRQITETLRFHLSLNKKTAQDRAIELLQSVGIPNPAMRLKQHPHQLSGGMRQRVAIAIALSCRPQLLIADEPTTALDVTVQRQILCLLTRLQQELSMAMIFVTHDLAVAASLADEIAVMYAGQIVERAAAFDIFNQARMPYTKMLIEAVPRLKNPPHTKLPVIEGRPPELIDPPPGCRFGPRCPKAVGRCFQIEPDLTGDPDSSHIYACFFPETEGEKSISSGAVL